MTETAGRRGSRALPVAIALVGVLAGGVGAPGAVRAQNFFERLFGIVPSRPPAPFNAPPEAPAPPPASSGGGEDAPKPRPSAPAPARPVAIKAPSEDSVLGRDLKLDGVAGLLRLDRTGTGDVKARMTLAGRRSPTAVETCQIEFGQGDGVPLVSLGKPEGVQRYQLKADTCTVQLDILDEAVLVKGPSEGCVSAAAQCQGDPAGLWGPSPGNLIGRARDFETARGSADKAVRDNYKVLTQRARPEAARPIVAEQAAFSADREQVCRSYAREGAHGFCNARFTEARAVALATRLGVSTTAAAQPVEVRVRRRSTDPYSLPSSDELMQRAPAEGE